MLGSTQTALSAMCAVGNGILRPSAEGLTIKGAAQRYVPRSCIGWPAPCQEWAVLSSDRSAGSAFPGQALSMVPLLSMRSPLSRGSLQPQTQRILRVVPTPSESLSLLTKVAFLLWARAAKQSA